MANLQRKERPKFRLDGSPKQRPGPKPKIKADAMTTTLAIDAAIERCERAYTGIVGPYFEACEGMEKGLTVEQREKGLDLGRKAFCGALPRLQAGIELQCFIACVAKGCALGVFNGREGSQLLYAAQICSSAAKRL